MPPPVTRRSTVADRMPAALLALDTSTRTVGLALYDGAQVLCETVWSSADYHTVELAPAVAEALKKTRIEETYRLGALAVALGPGSFTGLRIGLAFAKGLALAKRLPILGVPTLDALASAQPLCEGQMAAVLRAGRGRLAVGWYHTVDGAWQLSQKVEVLTPQALVQKINTPTLVCGELDDDERGLFKGHQQAILASPARCLRRPAFLAELAWGRWKAGQVDDPASLAPIYLHYNAPISVEGGS
jgi:tRNA threonylcarbamoyladenosine biosynthesis protein TsaB